MCRIKVFVACLVLLSFSSRGEVRGSETNELVSFVETAMRQSDVAYDIQDSLELGKIDIAGARHKFDTRIVPLTSIGFTQGTGSQKLGLEFQKDMEAGTSVRYGLVGDRVDESSNYVVENSHTARAYVRVTQGLFRRWGTEYNRTDLDVAEIRDRQRAIEAERSRQALILSTCRKYYALILEDQLYAKAEKALERSREHLESAVSRQSVGLVSKVDVYRAELALLNTENSLQTRKRQMEKAIDDFKEQLRFEDTDPLSWEKEVQKLTPVLPESFNDVIYDHRMDWQSFQMKTWIAKRERYRVERNLMPDVGLSFMVEQSGEGDNIEDAVRLDETNWSLQLEMLSSLDTFNEEASMTRKKMELSKLRREGDTLRRKIAREVRDGLADLKMVERQHQVSLRQLEQAGMALELAKIRYEKGLSNNLDVIDAESAYSDAEISISRSLITYNNAAIELAHAMGLLNMDWLHLAMMGEDG